MHGDLAHLQKLMSDKKCPQEKKSEMEEVITQVGPAVPFAIAAFSTHKYNAGQIKKKCSDL